MKRARQAAGYTIIGAIAFLAGQGITWGQSNPQLNYYWTEPTTGSPVVEWVIDIEFGGQEITTVTVPKVLNEFGGWFLLPYPYGESVRIRVAGNDAQGRTGTFTDWSAWFNDDGPPGVAGAILVTLVGV